MVLVKFDQKCFSFWKLPENGIIKGTITGVSIGSSVTPAEKIWRTFQALGDIAFAYSYAIVLIEIEVYMFFKTHKVTTI